MELFLSFVIFLFIISTSFNIYFYIRLKKIPFKKEDMIKNDLNLLHDLTSGRARTLIEIKRIAPSDFFLRSPK